MGTGDVLGLPQSPQIIFWRKTSDGLIVRVFESCLCPQKRSVSFRGKILARRNADVADVSMFVVVFVLFGFCPFLVRLRTSLHLWTKPKHPHLVCPFLSFFGLAEDAQNYIFGPSGPIVHLLEDPLRIRNSDARRSPGFASSQSDRQPRLANPVHLVQHDASTKCFWKVLEVPHS